jgi:hypothetical protein
MLERASAEEPDAPEAQPESQGSAEVASHVARAAGWLILTAAITRIPALMAPLLLLAVSTKAAVTLALMTFPFWCLAAAGALGLILKRTWGFYAIYVYMAVSLYGLGIPFLAGFSFFPLLERLVHLGPLQPYLHLAFNLLVTLMLVWAHHGLGHADSWLRQPRRLLLAGLLAAVFFAGGLWRQRFHHLNRAVPTVTELPVVGSVFAGFETDGPVEVCSIRHPAVDGFIAVFAGVTEAGDISDLARRLELTSIDREEGWRKMLPVLKSWRMDETRFPREFGAGALHYSGRMPGHRKLQFQLCWRPEDRRFCGQIFGIVARQTDPTAAPSHSTNVERPATPAPPAVP